MLSQYIPDFERRLEPTQSQANSFIENNYTWFTFQNLAEVWFSFSKCFEVQELVVQIRSTDSVCTEPFLSIDIESYRRNQCFFNIPAQFVKTTFDLQFYPVHLNADRVKISLKNQNIRNILQIRIDLKIGKIFDDNDSISQYRTVVKPALSMQNDPVDTVQINELMQRREVDL